MVRVLGAYALTRYPDDLGEYQLRIYAMTKVLKSAFGFLASEVVFLHERRFRHKDIESKDIPAGCRLSTQTSAIIVDLCI